MIKFLNESQFSRINYLHMSTLYLPHTRGKKKSLVCLSLPQILEFFFIPVAKNVEKLFEVEVTLPIISREWSFWHAWSDFCTSRQRADRVTNLWASVPSPYITPVPSTLLFLLLTPTLRRFFFIFLFLNLFTNSATSELSRPLVLVVKNQ